MAIPLLSSVSCLLSSLYYNPSASCFLCTFFLLGDHNLFIINVLQDFFARRTFWLRLSEAKPRQVLCDLCGLKPFLQNKANFKIGNINISTARTKTYANEQRTMSNERYSKQTQQVLSGVEGTNPIPPPPSCAGKESRISERNAYPDLSGQHQRSRIKHLPHLTTESWRYCAKQTQFPQSQNQRNPLCRKGLRK